MRFRQMLLAWMIGLGANSHAASEPISLELIEWLGELNESDTEFEQAMTEVEQQTPTPARQTTSDKPQSSSAGGNKQ